MCLHDRNIKVVQQVDVGPDLRADSPDELQLLPGVPGGAQPHQRCGMGFDTGGSQDG